MVVVVAVVVDDDDADIVVVDDDDDDDVVADADVVVADVRLVAAAAAAVDLEVVADESDADAAETVVLANFVVAIPLIDKKEWNGSAVVYADVVAPVAGNSAVGTVDLVVDVCYYVEVYVLVQMLALNVVDVFAIDDMVQHDAA